ncbi:MAG: hypothetical protein VX919_05655, partial [Candidatus Thermoplasmatota archaeon]|nr:hypothetical protein [Candidatus Thermoplasmatota archaeon]
DCFCPPGQEMNHGHPHYRTSAPRAEDGVWPVASSSFRLTSMRRPCWATPTEGQDRPKMPWPSLQGGMV